MLGQIHTHGAPAIVCKFGLCPKLLGIRTAARDRGRVNRIRLSSGRPYSRLLQHATSWARRIVTAVLIV